MNFESGLHDAALAIDEGRLDDAGRRIDEIAGQKEFCHGRSANARHRSR